VDAAGAAGAGVAGFAAGGGVDAAGAEPTFTFDEKVAICLADKPDLDRSLTDV
jgi:hypothetical protein